MPIIARLRQSIIARWYRYRPTQRLIEQVVNNDGESDINALLDALKERLAHQDGTLAAVDWSDARLDGALLSSCSLTETSFSRASLIGAYFGYSDLRHASFEATDLQDANLRQALLEYANMSGANLSGANLARANLSHSILIDANLSEANLWETDLRGANLSRALLSGCAIQNIRTDQFTILPDGNHCGEPHELEAFTLPRKPNCN